MNRLAQTIFLAFKNEATRKFGILNFFFVLLGALVIMTFADDIPEMLYNVSMAIVDGFTKQHHPMAELSKPPFWQVAVSFLSGQAICIVGTIPFAAMELERIQKRK